jgi:hypothetical protein
LSGFGLGSPSPDGVGFFFAAGYPRAQIDTLIARIRQVV